MAKKAAKVAKKPVKRASGGSAQAELEGVERKELRVSGPVQCLGQTFANDEARRTHYLALLQEKLSDPAFRAMPGFPLATDEAILRMSDPPYYTACPNPFLEEFVRFGGRPSDSNEEYRREPFAVDVSVGKTDALYKAHGYHTKVPHLAIAPSILHYTVPGDVVLDGFCGSGMTGVAAQWCELAPATYRQKLESDWKKQAIGKPVWGRRQAILADLSPAATFIAAGYNVPFDVDAFEEAGKRILAEAASELGWMYEAKHKGKVIGRINYAVWSEVFACPECSESVTFVKEAIDRKTKRTRDSFPCPGCAVELSKSNLEQSFETIHDPVLGRARRRIRLVPALIQYPYAGGVITRELDEDDKRLIEKIGGLKLPPEVPTDQLPIEQMYHGSRLAPKGFTHVHHLFLPRAVQALGFLWRRSQAADGDLRQALTFWVEQAIWGMSVLARYAPTHYSQVNQYLNGVYYVGSQIVDVSPWYILEGKLGRLVSAWRSFRSGGRAPTVAVSTGDCASLPLASETVDYVFTDPPFGENIFYADLNLLVEAWHANRTAVAQEAIVDTFKRKGTHEYQTLMRECFEAYYRVLKPGRWMTVVFSNSSNAIWRAIQEALGTAGFVVAGVRTLDKQQGSYKQVTSTAVKQDLIISAYKPTAALAQKFKLETVDPESAWAFVGEHLRNVPVLATSGGKAEVVDERTAQVLLDRMIAFHVQRQLAVPLSSAEFLEGLVQRYLEREGMYFLAEQVGEYDRKRASTDGMVQLSLSVQDEAGAIRWVRQQLHDKPQPLQDLTPKFLQEIGSWVAHEATVELKEILQQNFLCYDGEGPVPPSVHGYLSSNFKGLRNLANDDEVLREKAKGRWYVPDPARLVDLEKLRDRALLKEFEAYRTSPQRQLKLFRTEALRAGFKAAYTAQEYQVILDVAGKLPEQVLQEDEKLLMYFDVATMRLEMA